MIAATPVPKPTRPRKPSVKIAAKTALRRLLHPRHALNFLRHLRPAKAVSRASDDVHLGLYAEVLPGGFLNYGYFDDTDIPPERLSLHDIQEAQIRYGRLLADLVPRDGRPVLDAGCGMGGLLNLLRRRGCHPTALTPDRNQVRYIRSKYPDVELIPTKFEAIPVQSYRHHFGTVIMSESMQYMKLRPAMAAVRDILAPGGRWILCDYFRLRETTRRSGHCWTTFNAALRSEGWKVVQERDITAHALPAIRFLHMLGQRAALPALRYAVEKIRRRRPALHYLLEEFLTEARGFAEQQLEILDPEIFQHEKAYMLMVLERA